LRCQNNPARNAGLRCFSTLKPKGTHARAAACTLRRTSSSTSETNCVKSQTSPEKRGTSTANISSGGCPPRNSAPKNSVGKIHKGFSKFIYRKISEGNLLCTEVYFDNPEGNSVLSNGKLKLLLREVYFDEDVFGHAKAHQLSHSPVVGVKIDQTSVNPHLPLVPGLCAVAVGGFHRRYLQFLCRERLRTLDLYAGLFSNALYFPANVFQTCEVCTGKLYSCKGRHWCSSSTRLLEASI